MLLYAWTAAAIGGPVWRFTENALTSVAAIYTAYKLITAGRSFLGTALAAACLGIGANAIIEASLYLNSDYSWYQIANVGRWYQFGNHLRNPTVIVMEIGRAHV